MNSRLPPTCQNLALPEQQEPIDIVYLWVNGADPVWRDKRQQALQRSGAAQPRDLAVHGDVAGRYRDNDELRFNLRALEKFYPEHGHIYLVTDGQIPAWLETHPRLSLIDHAELIPAAALPVFDSGHIESYLHHIPGLAERFIYLNDDVFFGAEVDPELWFGSEGLAVFTEKTRVPDYDQLQAHESALVNASVLSKHWLSQRYPHYLHAQRIFAHSPRPMLKSVLHELELAAPELFQQVRQTVFRSWQVPPLMPDLVPRWMLHTGRAAEQNLEPLYISSGACDAEQQFQTLVDEFGRIPFFCINDTSDDALDDAPQLRKISHTLAKLLPTPSSFERHRD
ncbi:Stealth CR1 domain-containing protein [Undibacterium parvum]|uniref:Capsular polysaccharide phosphotransferase SacB n=1 Tax=Undibacterium parvum TaxID=401471 RepID=A0A3S9HN29_9BURK|nr:Stealth CR1 domain-containing protein [Undibacterium parvum]AZP13498.1 exopolysaccharide phosphotransferase [Undibacterium parvum]